MPKTPFISGSSHQSPQQKPSQIIDPDHFQAGHCGLHLSKGATFAGTKDYDLAKLAKIVCVQVFFVLFLLLFG